MRNSEPKTKMQTKMRYSQPFGELSTGPGGKIKSSPKRPSRSNQERARKANELLSIIGKMRAE